MIDLANYPLLLFALSFFVLWLSERIGSFLLKRQRKMAEDVREDFSVVQSATLTLLGLLIGFSFSMAISRYDERNNYEEAEANAIGTEYIRADLLPSGDAAKVRALLRSILISVSCSTRTAITKSFCGSMPILLNCRASYGPQSAPRPHRSQHQWLPWPFQA
jgi:hypothetical protein